MRILKEEIPIFILYGIVFAYAIISINLAKPLPLTTIAIPVAITLFIIFLLHMINIFVRAKT